MKICHFILVSCFTIQTSLADFDCREITNKTAKCHKEFNCIYDDDYKMRIGGSNSCRCKIVITGFPLPDKWLQQDILGQICSKFEYRLQELWVNDIELEYLDNEIFEKFQNLYSVNLAENNLVVNFSESAKNLKELDLSYNRLKSVDSDCFIYLTSLKILNLSFNTLDTLNFVSYNGALEELYLSNNHINSISEYVFGQLCNLKILDLAHNRLSSFLEVYFCSIEKLYLDNNKLVTVDLFIEFQNLQILNLGKNLLNDTRYSRYARNVKELHFENNKIVKLNKTVMSEIDNATDINLSNNLLKSIEANTFAPNNKINILDLGSNKLSEIDANNFQNFKNVTILNLSDNLLTEEVINCDNLQYLVNVTVLSLSHNQISQIYNCTFSKLQKLTNLSLSANQIKKIPPSAFRESTKLQELDLSLNKINEIPTGLFDNLAELKKLNLSHNQIEYFDISSLNHSKNLTEFDISFNSIKDLDLRLLISKLPSLKVIDFDKHLVKCEVYSDIVQYFDENSIVLKSCTTSQGCCKESKLFTILAVSVAVLVLIVTILCCVLCLICYCRRSKQYNVTIPMKEK